MINSPQIRWGHKTELLNLINMSNKTMSWTSIFLKVKSYGMRFCINYGILLDQTLWDSPLIHKTPINGNTKKLVVLYQHSWNIGFISFMFFTKCVVKNSLSTVHIQPLVSFECPPVIDWTVLFEGHFRNGLTHALSHSSRQGTYRRHMYSPKW